MTRALRQEHLGVYVYSACMSSTSTQRKKHVHKELYASQENNAFSVLLCAQVV